MDISIEEKLGSQFIGDKEFNELTTIADRDLTCFQILTADKVKHSIHCWPFTSILNILPKDGSPTSHPGIDRYFLSFWDDIVASLELKIRFRGTFLFLDSSKAPDLGFQNIRNTKLCLPFLTIKKFRQQSQLQAYSPSFLKPPGWHVQHIFIVDHDDNSKVLMPFVIQI